MLEKRIEELTAAVIALTAKMGGAAPAASAPAAASAPSHTIDTVRASLTALIAKKGKEVAAALLKSKGLGKLSDCKPEGFADLAAAIDAEIKKEADPLA